MTSVERTFAFVDLAGFTALTEAHGDAEAVELLDRFVACVAGALSEGDELVKQIGDAVMLASPAPAAGVHLVARVFDRCFEQSDFPLPRAGLHHGPAIPRDGDYFGAAVNLAARVAAQAYGGQVLATPEVALRGRALGFDTVDLGAFALRNVSEPVHLFELGLRPSHGDAGIDPVCRMRVPRERAAGRLRHAGVDHWFCSLECAAAFASDPERFGAEA